ncbi:T9SS type A sorting domain-containing protein [Crocinitomix catalasitica]|uniref:T9SS type A sorting domain-containing protein n=1 Tax=Crocinitomix catalasitica TaxID=184607 RepID=UPI0004893774|nr:T9SS type A sorting domain-containing protein [Crocinitomix catalasitica]
MKKTLIFSYSFLFFCSALFGQQTKPDISNHRIIGQATKSEIFETEKAGFIQTSSADLDWQSALILKKRKIKHGTASEISTDSLKAIKSETKYEIESEIESPTNHNNPMVPNVNIEFRGNSNDGSSPLDNSIAISDDGIIVSVINSNIEYYDEDGDELYSNSIADLVDDAEIVAVCDPVILYDSEADRFIFFAQECSGNSANSYLLVLFSETNDPRDGWNYYKITGNPLDNNSWFDYPKMAISENELFISGNLFSNSGVFREAVVYQIDKSDGYAGISLTWQFWSDIPGDPFTILPVSSGTEVNYGPGIYAVSSESFSGNDYNFYDITSDIADGPSMNFYTVDTDPYEVAGDSRQDGTACRLNNGDCRLLSGFYLDGIIHFVHHSDVGSGWNGINYNRLDVVDLENETSLFGDVGNMDYSYPAVAYFGDGAGDKTVMIGFGSASSDVFPEIRVVSCNTDFEWSRATLVYESFDYVCYTAPSRERWGDYSGISRKHNALEPTIWMSGAYGTLANTWFTRIAEITDVSDVGISEVEDKVNLNLAPNPVKESFTLQFELEENTPLTIQLFSIEGKLVKEFYNGTAYQGINTFKFNKSNLSSGTYILEIKSPSINYANEKIVIN